MTIRQVVFLRGGLILMMRYWLILVALLWGMCTVMGQSVVHFEVKEHDFGEIKESGECVSFAFKITNGGSVPLVIQKAETTCSCTKICFSKKPILPKGTGSITVSYDPRKQEGVFLKAIKLYTNLSSSPLIITIRGSVVR